jgi:hypothetical protein
MMGYEWNLKPRVKEDKLEKAINDYQIALNSMHQRLKTKHSNLGSRIQSIENARNEIRNKQQHFNNIYNQYLNQLRDEAARRVPDLGRSASSGEQASV